MQIESFIDILSDLKEQYPVKVVISNPKKTADIEYKKIVIERKIIGGKIKYQVAAYTEKQVFHTNISEDKLEDEMEKYFPESFKQINLFGTNFDYDLKAGKKGNITVNKRAASIKKIELAGNNRKKKYILEEGMDIPVFRELGIFTVDGKVVHSMYDKFKQINRFAELVDDVLKYYKKEEINIIDFGCGKSYLTFILYYYLVEIRHIKAHIIGLDLKADVIKKCSNLAEKFGYSGLKFEIGDINGYKNDREVDMIVTLHACDTATDYALYNAICWNATYILSVPCCQHEVNKQIKSDKLSALTKYGIIKERTSALITDAVRGCVLEAKGYKTELVEFIDIAHSPKNILIRAEKKNVTKEKKEKSKQEATNICNEFGIQQSLYTLCFDENK